MDQKEKFWLIEITIKAVKKQKKISVLFLLYNRLGSVAYFLKGFRKEMLWWGTLLRETIPINIRKNLSNKPDDS